MGYNSRASQLYREKLHSIAAQAMRVHGTKLHLEGANETTEQKEEKQDDFFASAEDFTSTSSNNIWEEPATALVKPKSPRDPVKNGDDGPAPDVSMAVSGEVKATAPRKSTIGAKKPAKKPGGLGGKKGLGATKVTKNFDEIERDAEMADNIAVARREEAKVEAAKTEEEAMAQMASMRLAYQDLTTSAGKQQKELSKMDPKKAEQMERLGMGFGGGGGAGLGAGIQSHSLSSSVIVQEEPNNTSKPQFGGSTKDKFFDDFEVVDKEEVSSGWGKGSSRLDEICAPSSSSSKSAWEQDLNENVAKSASKSTSSWETNFGSKPKRTPTAVNSASPAGEEAVKKFGNAKSISSDMYFGGPDQDTRDANLSRFQGSASISSDMYFNRDTPNAGGGGGMPKSASSYSMQAPDMEDVKESVRQGVSKLGGRLSGMASGVMGSIQDKYGY